MNRFAIASLALLAACSTTPRVSTESERNAARAMLTTIETGVTALAVTGHLTDEQLHLAIQQIADLRQEVDDSAFTPKTWADLLQRITNLALQWAIELNRSAED